MPLSRPLVDVEALLFTYLAGDGALETALGGTGADPRISSELDADFPDEGAKWLQVFRVSATTPDPETGYLERVLVQVNAYGSTKAEAWEVVATAYRALLDARHAQHAGAVVSTVEKLTGPTWSPDPSNGAPRYTSSFAITVHPRS